MFRFELFLKGLMDFFDAHTKFLIIKRMNFKYPFSTFNIKSEISHNDIAKITSFSIDKYACVIDSLEPIYKI